MSRARRLHGAQQPKYAQGRLARRRQADRNLRYHDNCCPLRTGWHRHFGCEHRPGNVCLPISTGHFPADRTRSLPDIWPWQGRQPCRAASFFKCFAPASAESADTPQNGCHFCFQGPLHPPLAQRIENDCGDRCLMNVGPNPRRSFTRRCCLHSPLIGANNTCSKGAPLYA